MEANSFKIPFLRSLSMDVSEAEISSEEFKAIGQFLVSKGGAFVSDLIKTFRDRPKDLPDTPGGRIGWLEMRWHRLPKYIRTEARALVTANHAKASTGSTGPVDASLQSAEAPVKTSVESHSGMDKISIVKTKDESSTSATEHGHDHMAHAPTTTNGSKKRSHDSIDGSHHELIDTDKPENDTSKAVTGGLDGSTHHENSSSNRLDHPVLLLAKDEVGSWNPDLGPLQHGTTKTSSESIGSSLVGTTLPLAKVEPVPSTSTESKEPLNEPIRRLRPRVSKDGQTQTPGLPVAAKSATKPTTVKAHVHHRVEYHYSHMIRSKNSRDLAELSGATEGGGASGSVPTSGPSENARGKGKAKAKAQAIPVTLEDFLQQVITQQADHIRRLKRMLGLPEGDQYQVDAPAVVHAIKELAVQDRAAKKPRLN